VNDPNAERVFVRRRRRTRRHRRNRSIRRSLLVAGLVGVGLGLAFWLLPDDFGTYLASFIPSKNPPVRAVDIRRELANNAQSLDELPDPPGAREVYPYSLVPVGVRSARELRAVFDHDPVLKAHYRNFDFNRARLVRLLGDRTVYVSYRIGNKIYWTTKLVRLHAGEMLLTDGVMNVRTRCGNQISENPRMEVSPEEPKVATLEKPVALPDPSPSAAAGPVEFDSALRRPDFPGLFPPATPPGLIGSVNGFGPVFPAGVCGPGKKKNSGPPIRTGNGGKKKGGPCSSGGGGGGTVPEPTSFALLASGLGGLYFRYRARRSA